MSNLLYRLLLSAIHTRVCKQSALSTCIVMDGRGSWTDERSIPPSTQESLYLPLLRFPYSLTQLTGLVKSEEHKYSHLKAINVSLR